MRAQNSVLEDISAVIGFTATTRLVAIFGTDTGRNLLVPVVATEDHAIARAIGLPAARALSAEWGGQVLKLGAHADLHHARLVRAVANMIKGGMPTKDVAIVVGLSERQVRNLRTEAEDMGMLPLVLQTKAARRVGVVVDELA